MKSSKVKQILNVTQQTLSNYVAKGILHPVKLSKTHYEYDEDEVYALLGKNKNNDRMVVTYARVSLAKQRMTWKAKLKGSIPMP